MEWVIVRFPRVRDVFIDQRLVGQTNLLLSTKAGPQRFDLGPGGGYRPVQKKVTVANTDVDDPLVIAFLEG